MRIDKRARFRTRVNHRIRVPEVRVVSEEGEQLGVMTTDKAIARALEVGLDLVEVSPTARPPVCRIMDYGKFKYEQNKRAKQSKKKQHFVQVKEIKFRPKTEEHDYQFKKKHAIEFLQKLNKVKFTVIFRGREMDHRELGMRMLKRVEKELSEIGVVESHARFEGRLMTMMMAPIPAKPGSRPKKTDRKTKPAPSPSSGEEGSTSATETPPSGAEGSPGATETPPSAESPAEDAGSPAAVVEDSPSAETQETDAVDTNKTAEADVEREDQNAEDQDEPRSEKEIS